MKIFHKILKKNNLNSYTKTKDMKKSYVLLLTLALGVSGLTGCKREGCTDEAATNYNEKAKKDDGSCEYEDITLKFPVITVNGDNPTSVFLGDSYVDQGATATNPEDGSSAEVEVEGDNIDTSVAGEYEVTYTATNQYGTSTATREVNVVVGVGNYEGSYSTDHDCSTTRFPIAGSTDIELSSASTVTITNAFNLIGGEIEVSVDNMTATVEEQTVSVLGSDIIFNGSGTMNNTGTELVINYNYNNLAPLIGGSGSCTVTYIKE